jgi:hypothetical protein
VPYFTDFETNFLGHAGNKQSRFLVINLHFHDYLKKCHYRHVRTGVDVIYLKRHTPSGHSRSEVVTIACHVCSCCQAREREAKKRADPNFREQNKKKNYTSWQPNRHQMWRDIQKIEARIQLGIWCVMCCKRDVYCCYQAAHVRQDGNEGLGITTSSSASGGRRCPRDKYYALLSTR